MREKGTRGSISMPEEFLKDVDKVANDEMRSRSELIRHALRKYMEKVLS